MRRMYSENQLKKFAAEEVAKANVIPPVPDVVGDYILVATVNIDHSLTYIWLSKN